MAMGSRPRPRGELDLSEPQNLSRLQNRFRDLFAVDERAVRGVEVLDDDVRTAQDDFAVMAGYGLVCNLESIVIHTADGGFFHLQLMEFSSESLTEDDEFCHICFQ